MSDPISALAERLRRVPMRCSNCRRTTRSGEDIQCPDAPEHSWEADDEALAREAFAFAREQLLTREELAYRLKCIAFDQLFVGVDWSHPSNLRWLDEADAILRDLRARLGGER